MSELKIASNLHLPASAVTRKFAVLGTSGSGKTYCAGKMVEELLGIKAQVVVVDVVGNWWGLRLAADGKKSSGFTLPILGGERGDIALEPTHGKLVAETVVESRSSMILDVSDFTQGEIRKFITEFSINLLALKKRSRTPLMVVWEECHEIVPQHVMGEDARMVGAVERLVKRGRNYGVGTTLISQRPQAVNKNVLNQVETIFAFTTIGTQERKAIKDWVDSKAPAAKDFAEELSSLPQGTGFVWSPSWLKVFHKFTTSRKKTFDASATPDFDDDAQTGKLQPIDLEKFKSKMGAAIETARANDPELLKKRIAELEKQAAKPAERDLKPAKVIEREVVKPATLLRIERFTEKLEMLSDKYTKQMVLIAAELQQLRGTMRSVQQQNAAPIKLPYVPPPLPVPRESAVPDGTWRGEVFQKLRQEERERPRVSKDTKDMKDVKGPGELGKCAREIVAALASYEQLSRRNTAIASGYSHKSSGYANALSELNTGGYVEKSGSFLKLTESGFALVGSVRTSDATDLFQRWSPKLSGKERWMLETVIQKPRGRSELAELVELSPTSSGFANYLSTLNSLGLVEKRDGRIYPNELFVRRASTP